MKDNLDYFNLNYKILDLENLVFILLSFFWVVIASNQVAKVFQKIKLPLITGFLLSGILIGPYILDLIHSESIPKLNMVNYTSLAFIAFTAGNQLYLKEIRNSIKSIIWNSISQLIITFVFISVSVFLLQDLVPFLSELNNSGKVAIAVLSGTIFIAKSPSSVVAVMGELRAKGRFSQMAISVTVILDVLVIVLFSICLSLVNNLMNDITFDFIFIIILLLELVTTLLLGFVLFKIFKLLLSVPVSYYIKSIMVLILGFGVYELTDYIKLLSNQIFRVDFFIEPLLVCITGSFLVTNFSKYRDDLDIIIKKVGTIVYAAFFTLAGAALSIDILIETWLVALIIFMVYILSIITASFIGNGLALNPKLYRKIGWMPFVTQAGVGFALVYEVIHDFPDWGNQFATTIIAVIVLNQIVGPPLFKWAIKLVNESHLPKRAGQTNKNVLIFGLEHQSLRLARDLSDEDYQVEIASVEKRKNIPHIDDIKIHFLEDISAKCLESIKIKKFHTVILMLSDGENYKAGKLLFNKFEAKLVIVRLFDSIFADKFHELGALVVDPANAISKLIEQFVRSPIAGSIILGEENKNAIVDIKIKDKNLHGIALRDLRLPSDSLILAVKRKGQMLISHGYTRLRKGDIVTVVGSLESLANLSLQFEE